MSEKLKDKWRTAALQCSSHVWVYFWFLVLHMEWGWVTDTWSNFKAQKVPGPWWGSTLTSPQPENIYWIINVWQTIKQHFFFTFINLPFGPFHHISKVTRKLSIAYFLKGLSIILCIAHRLTVWEAEFERVAEICVADQNDISHWLMPPLIWT